MNNQYQITSQLGDCSSSTQPEPHDFLHSHDETERFTNQAVVIEDALWEKDVWCHVMEIKTAKYFTTHCIEISKKDNSFRDVANCKESLMVELSTPYVHIYYPVPIPHTSWIGIEIPNIFPKDEYLIEKVEDLKELDFFFIKIFSIIVKYRKIDMKILRKGMDIEEDVLVDILNDMKDMGIWKGEKRKKVLVTDIDLCGKYWKEWEEANHIVY